jgi:hypothetical protein
MVPRKLTGFDAVREMALSLPGDEEGTTYVFAAKDSLRDLLLMGWRAMSTTTKKAAR